MAEEKEQPAMTPEEGVAGDVPQEPAFVPVVPEEPEEPEKGGQQKTEEAAEQEKTSKEEEENAKKSQAEWQEMKETVKAFGKLKQVLVGDKEEANEISDKELMEGLVNKVKGLEFETARAKWEAKHPQVMNESYTEKWEKIVKEKGHLVKDGQLTYDELFKLIQDQVENPYEKKAREEAKIDNGSVPMFPKSSPSKNSNLSNELVSELQKVGREMGFNWSKERILQETAA